MKITFLVRNIWGIGGTIKTTLNTTAALVEMGHDVTIASCIRTKEKPDFDIDPRIEIISLWDVRDRAEGGDRLSPLDRWRARKPSYLDADEVNNMSESSKLLDVKVERFLRGLRTDVLVGTQVAMNLYMAEYGRPERYPMVAQEHLYFDCYKEGVRRRIVANYPKLDAVVTITEADADTYREALPEHADKVVYIPNAVPASANPPSELTDPVIMTAGRMTGMKGFDLLIRAFAQLAEEFPEWRVKIFGRGRAKKMLKGLIAELELKDRVEIRSGVTALGDEWQHASIAAIPSRFEPFGLVIVEAMAAGVPVVCTAVKHGPLVLIESEVNGLLVEAENPDALADGLRRLMSDPQLRRKLADNAVETARRFEPGKVTGRHVELFEKLLRTRA